MPSLATIRLSLGLAAALALAGCSGDPIKVASPARIFDSPEWANISASPKRVGLGAVTADDLVSADGQCAAGPETVVAGAPAEAGQPPGLVEARGVAPEMTECQVVRRIGHPDRVEIGADPGGQRATVITYLEGTRPGIYHFVAGRLKQIERAPEPPAPAKRAKPKKSAKPRTAAN